MEKDLGPDIPEIVFGGKGGKLNALCSVIMYLVFTVTYVDNSIYSFDQFTWFNTIPMYFKSVQK